MKLKFRGRWYDAEPLDTAGWVCLALGLQELSQTMTAGGLSKRQVTKLMRDAAEEHLVPLGIPLGVIKRAKLRDLARALKAVGDAAKETVDAS